MTNEKLNETCCELAGIEKQRIRIKKPDGLGSIWAERYPPVSTSWEWAGRLMDALKAKGIQGQLFWSVTYDSWTAHVERIYSTDGQATGPMALALAVAELAKFCPAPVA